MASVDGCHVFGRNAGALALRAGFLAVGAWLPGGPPVGSVGIAKVAASGLRGLRGAIATGSMANSAASGLRYAAAGGDASSSSGIALTAAARATLLSSSVFFACALDRRASQCGVSLRTESHIGERVGVSEHSADAHASRRDVGCGVGNMESRRSSDVQKPKPNEGAAPSQATFGPQ